MNNTSLRKRGGRAKPAVDSPFFNNPTNCHEEKTYFMGRKEELDLKEET
jgi:hypothetical protein